MTALGQRDGALIAGMTVPWAVLAALGAFALVWHLSQPGILLLGTAFGLDAIPTALILFLATSASTVIALRAEGPRSAAIQVFVIAFFAILLPSLRTARDLSDCGIGLQIGCTPLGAPNWQASLAPVALGAAVAIVLAGLFARRLAANAVFQAAGPFALALFLIDALPLITPWRSIAPGTQVVAIAVLEFGAGACAAVIAVRRSADAIGVTLPVIVLLSIAWALDGWTGFRVRIPETPANTLAAALPVGIAATAFTLGLFRARERLRG
jgi:hypothetical protein